MDGSFTYDPTGRFEYLGLDERATDSFIYEVLDEHSLIIETASGQETSQGIGLAGIVFIIFLVLKLAEIGQVARWSWWWVTSPLWLPIMAMLAIYVLYGLFLMFIRR